MAFKRDALMSVTPEFWTVLVLMIGVASTAGFIEETLFPRTNPSVGRSGAAK